MTHQNELENYRRRYIIEIENHGDYDDTLYLDI